MKRTILYLSVIGVFLFSLTISPKSGICQSPSSEEGKILFNQKCVACHTVGGGKKVGPDLKGVTERRNISWIKGFILSPSSYFSKKDEIATGLLKEFSIPMPDLGLKEEEVEAIIAYLKDSQIQTAEGTTKPSQYFPTIAIAGGILFLLTVIGLIAGTKKVEVRS